MKKPTRTSKARGILQGYRSGFETRIAQELRAKGVRAEFESLKIPYTQPIKERHYTPDFLLPNGILIETKGRFTLEDRQKHQYIKQSYPHLDIRFVFQNPNQKISKNSPTSYAAWCEKQGFLYAAKTIPDAWLTEPRNGESTRALAAIAKVKTKKTKIT